MIELFGKQVPTTVAELATPSSTCLLVIDMQNDLCSVDGALARNGADVRSYQALVPRLRRLIDGARAAGVLVVFVRITTRSDHATQSPAQLYFEWRIRESYGSVTEEPLRYCIDGTWGHEVMPELGCRPADVTVDKYRSSAFVGTPLDLILRSNGIATVIATGGTTEGCLDSTVRDAGFLDYFTIVARDCVGSDNPRLHEAAMTILEAYRSVVVDSDELLAAWAREQA